MVNFDAIDRALAKLEEEEMKVEAAQLAATEQLRTSSAKLQRLRKQKRFLREKEQKMFDKELSDIEELERLEGLEQAATLEQFLPTATCFNDLAALSSTDLEWLNSPNPEIPAASAGNSQDS